MLLPVLLKLQSNLTVEQQSPLQSKEMVHLLKTLLLQMEQTQSQLLLPTVLVSLQQLQEQLHWIQEHQLSSL